MHDMSLYVDKNDQSRYSLNAGISGRTWVTHKIKEQQENNMLRGGVCVLVCGKSWGSIV